MSTKLITLTAVAALAVSLGGCGSNPTKSDSSAASTNRLSEPAVAKVAPVLKDPVGDYSAKSLGGDYASYTSVESFIDKMVEEHDFERDYLYGLFTAVERKDGVLKIMNRPRSKGPARVGSWSRYRNIFIKPERIEKGARFWADNKKTLEQVSREYGVPPEYIVAIIGVETYYGANVGRTTVIDGIATIAFDYPRRSEYFTGELEQFLLMAREEGFDPRQPVGSYAGAMGLGQFMPSSFRRWAVDQDGDGVRNLWEVDDAIGSVANYFRVHGWRSGEEVVIPASSSSSRYKSLETGYTSNYSVGELKKAGVKPRRRVSADNVHFLSFSTYDGDELYLGLNNFYVITRYNHSSKYAMAVHQLAQEIKREYKSMRYAVVDRGSADQS